MIVVCPRCGAAEDEERPAYGDEVQHEREELCDWCQQIDRERVVAFDYEEGYR